MNILKSISLSFLLVGALLFSAPVSMLAQQPAAGQQSGAGKSQSKGATKKERALILEGNNLYRSKKFQEAVAKYKAALQDNKESSVAAFNLALADIAVAASLQNQDSVANQLVQDASQLFQTVAQKRVTRNNLSSKAYYNLGNLAFYGEDYGNAVNLYKEALRLNPSDNNARRNLRIAQKKQQKQDKDKNKNQDQQQDKNQQQNQNKDKKQQPNQPQQPQQQKINNQTSDQILNAIERKENQARMRKNAQPTQASPRSGQSNKNW